MSGNFITVEALSSNFITVEARSGHYTPVEARSGHYTPVEAVSDVKVITVEQCRTLKLSALRTSTGSVEDQHGRGEVEGCTQGEVSLHILPVLYPALYHPVLYPTSPFTTRPDVNKVFSRPVNARNTGITALEKGVIDELGII